MRFVYTGILAVGVWAAIPSLLAAPLTGPELATLREIDARYPGSQPSEAAFALARRIGTEANLDGLRALVALRDLRLLNEAIQSFNPDASRVLPEPLEALIIEFYDDPDIRPRLLGMVGRALDREMERYPKYRSRKLFDLLLADLMARPQEAYWTAIRIVATDLVALEPALTAVLPSLEAGAANTVVTLLGTRRYAPAVPALRALQMNTPRARAGNDLFGHINHALLRIGTPAAQQAVLDRVAELRAEGSVATQEISSILDLASRLPPDARPDYVALRAALPTVLDPAIQSAAVQLIASRKDRRGIPELIDAVARGNDQALVALLALGGPSDWDAARLALAPSPGSGGRNPEQVARMLGRLDAALADPSRFIADRTAAERAESFAAARARLNRQLREAIALRGSDPRSYAIETERALKAAEGLLAENAGRPEAVPYRRDMAQAYRHHAGFTRFTLRDPVRAAALYERAIALSASLPDRENAAMLERIALADTARFDLGDSRRALRIYRQLDQEFARGPPSGNDIDGTLIRLARDWVRAEIAVLRDGKRYVGTPDRDTIGAVALIAYYGADGFRAEDASLAALAAALRVPPTSATERRALAQRLEALPPSQARILSTFDFLPLLETPERIATFVHRNDPAGFLSAAAFAGSLLVAGNAVGRAPPVPTGMRVDTWTASERALMRRAEATALGRKAVVDMRPDPGLGSPEGTWKTFLAALRKGDLPSALKCMTPGVRSRFEDSLRTMAPSAVKAMADAMVGLERSGEYGDFVEAVIVSGSGRAGFVTFVRQGKEWRIAEM